MAIQATDLTTATTTTVFTSSGTEVITFASFLNRSGGPITISVWVVPSAGSASDTNRIISGLSIPSGESYILYVGSEKIIFDNGDTLQVQASSASTINVVVSHVDY